jgi:hypothetical protein
MDPFTLTYFGIILPIAALATAVIIIRFRRNYRSQLKNYKADEMALQSRQPEEERRGTARKEPEAFDIDIDAPSPRNTSADGE